MSSNLVVAEEDNNHDHDDDLLAYLQETLLSGEQEQDEDDTTVNFADLGVGVCRSDPNYLHHYVSVLQHPEFRQVNPEEMLREQEEDDDVSTLGDIATAEDDGLTCPGSVFDLDLFADPLPKPVDRDQEAAASAERLAAAPEQDMPPLCLPWSLWCVSIQALDWTGDASRLVDVTAEIVHEAVGRSPSPSLVAYVIDASHPPIRLGGGGRRGGDDEDDDEDDDDSNDGCSALLHRCFRLQSITVGSERPIFRKSEGSFVMKKFVVTDDGDDEVSENARRRRRRRQRLRRAWTTEVRLSQPPFANDRDVAIVHHACERFDPQSGARTLCTVMKDFRFSLHDVRHEFYHTLSLPETDGMLNRRYFVGQILLLARHFERRRLFHPTLSPRHIMLWPFSSSSSPPLSSSSLSTMIRMIDKGDDDDHHHGDDDEDEDTADLVWTFTSIGLGDARLLRDNFSLLTPQLPSWPDNSSFSAPEAMAIPAAATGIGKGDPSSSPSSSSSSRTSEIALNANLFPIATTILSMLLDGRTPWQVPFKCDYGYDLFILRKGLTDRAVLQRALRQELNSALLDRGGGSPSKNNGSSSSKAKTKPKPRAKHKIGGNKKNKRGSTSANALAIGSGRPGGGAGGGGGVVPVSFRGGRRRAWEVAKDISMIMRWQEVDPTLMDLLSIMLTNDPNARPRSVEELRMHEYFVRPSSSSTRQKHHHDDDDDDDDGSDNTTDDGIGPVATV